jgi:hypothetical protein
MEAVNTSETSARFYETTLRDIPEDSHLCNESCFHFVILLFSLKFLWAVLTGLGEMWNVDHTVSEVTPGGLVVIVLAIGPRFRGFKAGRGRWIYKGDKNQQQDFLRRGSKAIN